MSKRTEQQLLLKLEEERKFRDGLELTQKVIRIGFEALSVRLLTALVLVADCGLFAWAMAAGGWEHLIAATIFAVASWCVIHLRPPDRRGNGDGKT